MCRLLGYVARSATSFSDVIGDEQSTTFQRLARVHGDGWGAMWIRDARTGPSLRRFRTQGDGLIDEALTSALATCPARAGVAHLRMATGGLPVRLTNTHPFTDGRFGLAHNGSIVPTAGLRAMLSAPSIMRLTGTTDSELYFALIRERLHDGLGLSAAVEVVVTTLRALYPLASLNAMVLSRRELVVVRASTDVPPPLKHFANRGFALEDLPRGHDEDYYRLSWRRTDTDAIAFASSGIDTSGWAELPRDSVTTVDLATLTLRSTALTRSGDGAAIERSRDPFVTERTRGAFDDARTDPIPTVV